MRKQLPILSVLLVYLVIGSLFAILTPDWEAPDEPAHYNYIRQLSNGDFPVIEPGDYNQEYLVQVVFNSHFAPQYSIEPMEYEDWQPPLYYILQTPIFWLSGGSLLALRLFSLLLGLGVILLGYGTAGQLFPEHEWVALTTAVFIAFLPQHLSIMASVNNDSLAELIIAGILLASIRWVRLERQGLPLGSSRKQLFSLGVLLGAGYLTKGTVYPISLLLGLVILRHFWGEWSSLIQNGLVLFLPAVVIGSLWWGRNILVYGGIDILGKIAHDAVVVGQPLTTELITNIGLQGAFRKFIQTTFNSFWGQFGWMTVLMPQWVYRLLWVFSTMVTIGVLFNLRRYHQKKKARFPNITLFPLVGLFLLTFAVHLGYNFTFEQHQGRYLFPALIPISIGVAIGINSWTRPLRPFLPLDRYLLPFGLALLLIVLDLWALFRVIVPAFN